MAWEFSAQISRKLVPFQLFAPNSKISPRQLVQYRPGARTVASLSWNGSKYPPAKPGALGCEPLKAAIRRR
jgi:hypothetical protein